MSQQYLNTYTTRKLLNASYQCFNSYHYYCYHYFYYFYYTTISNLSIR